MRNDHQPAARRAATSMRCWSSTKRSRRRLRSFPAQHAAAASGFADRPAGLLLEHRADPAARRRIATSFDGTFNPGTFLFNGNPYNQLGASNIFVAHQTSTSQVTWLGVPIDAPGTAGARILRMTNMRANACLVGTCRSSLVPSAITAFISITGITNLVYRGLRAADRRIRPDRLDSGRSANVGLQQCVSVNVAGSAFDA